MNRTALATAAALILLAAQPAHAVKKRPFWALFTPSTAPAAVTAQPATQPTPQVR